jgi:hypothetical protein
MKKLSIQLSAGRSSSFSYSFSFSNTNLPTKSSMLRGNITSDVSGG